MTDFFCHLKKFDSINNHFVEIERQQKEQEELDRIAAEEAEKARQAEGSPYHYFLFYCWDTHVFIGIVELN